MLVPTTKSTGTRNSCKARSTPMWAKPRAPPPDSTSATFGRGLMEASAAIEVAPGAVCAAAGAQIAAAKKKPQQKAAARVRDVTMGMAYCVRSKPGTGAIVVPETLERGGGCCCGGCCGGACGVGGGIGGQLQALEGAAFGQHHVLRMDFLDRHAGRHFAAHAQRHRRLAVDHDDGGAVAAAVARGDHALELVVADRG